MFTKTIIESKSIRNLSVVYHNHYHSHILSVMKKIIKEARMVHLNFGV